MQTFRPTARSARRRGRSSVRCGGLSEPNVSFLPSIWMVMSSETNGSADGSRIRVPRGSRRREEIAAVAERVFLQHGFSDTTMKMVANEAGASTETLYRHFGSKDDLFIEVVSNRTRDLRQRIETDLGSKGPLPAVLRAFGTNLYGAMIMPEMTALARIIVAEVQRNPALGEAFYAMAPGRTQRHLTDYLEAARRDGAFIGDDPLLAATMFIGLIIGKVVPVCLFIPHKDDGSRADMERHVDEAVRIFLAVYQAARPAA
ncbi:TetR/AcrR family transcriptional regulator [Methylobacterium sp. WL6]|nr:TetR/AcrR family transcriptional regulator [Methylobacterium sp. WL6]